MRWILAKLYKGNKYPSSIYWPDGSEAFIPLPEQVLSGQDANPPGEKMIQLYWKEINSDILHPLMWINGESEQKCAINIPEWIEALKGEKYRPEHNKPVIASSPFNYHYIPESIRYLVIAILTRARNKFPAVSFPVSLFNYGCEILLGVCNARWVSRVELPVLMLTHDIESEQGFDWIAKISEIEEGFGFRSIWNVVPMRYDVKKNTLYKLLEKGHEIGLHGLWHNCGEAFLSPEQMRREFNNQKLFMQEFSIRGYRSPSWYRTKVMFDVLAEFFSYDFSCLDNDLFCPGGKGGVGFMRPFIIRKELIEFPCTLPFEAPLYFGVSSERLVEFWANKIDFIKASEAMLLINTHSDPNYLGSDKLLIQYKKLLKKLADDKWHTKLPREAAKEMIA